MKTLIFSILIFGLSAVAQEVGFESGSQYTFTQLHGRIEINCSGFERVTHYCDGYVVHPAEASYFVAGAVAADRVELVGHHEDGSKTKKKAEYDSAAGRTASKVNLMVMTLFQKPILNLGKNRVEYTLKSGSTSVKSGEFEVNVEKQPMKLCPFRAYYEHLDSFCRQPEKQCHRYFNEVEEYCR